MAIEDDIRRLLETPLPLANLVREALRTPAPRTGNDEREARHEIEGTVISALADSLEARHRAEEHRERLEDAAARRAESGFRDEGNEHNVAYDFAAFGVHTLKTFLELNARANRKIIDALRKSTQDRPERVNTREPQEQPKAPVRLELDHEPLRSRPTPWSQPHLRLGRFELVNRRGTRLAFTMPPTVKLTPADAPEDALDIDLVFVPESVDLESGQTQEVFVELLPKDAHRLAERRHVYWEGEIEGDVHHGRHAPFPVFLTNLWRQRREDEGEAYRIRVGTQPITGDLTLYEWDGIDKDLVAEARVDDGIVAEEDHAAFWALRGLFLAELRDGGSVTYFYLMLSEGGKAAK